MIVSNIILNLFLWIASIMGFIGVIGIIPFSIVGIIFLVKSSNENDFQKQRSFRKKGIFFLILPWIFAVGDLILLIIIYGVLHLFMPVNSINF